jgi:hypothetical protein
MSDEENEVARIAGEIAGRIRRVCQQLPEADFAALCMTMARVQRHGEARAFGEWNALWWPEVGGTRRRRS